jgi:hypothetical protein
VVYATVSAKPQTRSVSTHSVVSNSLMS